MSAQAAEGWPCECPGVGIKVGLSLQAGERRGSAHAQRATGDTGVQPGDSGGELRPQHWKGSRCECGGLSCGHGKHKGSAIPGRKHKGSAIPELLQSYQCAWRARRHFEPAERGKEETGTQVFGIGNQLSQTRWPVTVRMAMRISIADILAMASSAGADEIS